MPYPTTKEQYIDRVIILFLFALLVLVSPLLNGWAADDAPWFLPYLIWLGLIGLIFWLQRRSAGRDI